MFQEQTQSLPNKLVLATLILGGVGFAIYMAGTYLLSGAHGQFQLWNTLLGNLHIPNRPVATAGIGLHIACGIVISVLGPIQLLSSVRQRWPRYHRYAGRVYVLAALLACAGGNLFIAINGTVGGPVMSVAFSLFGWLLGLAAWQSWRKAVQGDYEAHRRWAIRLFALGIGPLLYRFEYALWALCAGGLVGHQRNWQGPLDYVMDFFFFIPNLLICELYFAVERNAKDGGTGMRRWSYPLAIGSVLLLLIAMLLVGAKWWYPVLKSVWLRL